jgi:hypothetical protein
MVSLIGASPSTRSTAAAVFYRHASSENRDKIQSNE